MAAHAAPPKKTSWFGVGGPVFNLVMVVVLMGISTFIVMSPAEGAFEDLEQRAAEREAEVVDGERREDEEPVRGQDELGHPAQLLAVERHEHHDDGERDGDRDDRPRLAEPPADRELLGGDLPLARDRLVDRHDHRVDGQRPRVSIAGRTAR